MPHRPLRVRALLALWLVVTAAAWARPTGLEAFEHVWSRHPVAVLGLGDSVTVGYGATVGRGYFDLVVRGAADDPPAMRSCTLTHVLPALVAENRAVSSTTSDQHLDAMRRLRVAGPDVRGLVLLTTGGNDLIHSYGREAPRELAMYGATRAQAQPWIAAFGRRLDAMLLALQQRFPAGCHVFIATIYDPTDGRGDLENSGLALPPWPAAEPILQAYNDEIRAAARRHPHVRVVDVRRVLHGHGIHGTTLPALLRQADPNYWYYGNLEDPNERGYEAIRGAFLQSIAAVAGEF